MFLPEKYSLWRIHRQNMSAFAGHIITCFAEFSRVTRLAFAKELLVRISNKTLSVVQARFVHTNILVKKKAYFRLIEVATIAAVKETIIEIKATIALPFHSSLTTLVVQWWKKSARKVYCTFRVFALLIKPVSLFIFLVFFVVLGVLSSLVASLRKTILDMRLYILP